MKFALVNEIRTEATSGACGICPSCGSDLVAKCGDKRVHHWAHTKSRNCDTWWENETEWHRMWKNEFPADWQEVRAFDEQTGEFHIADVRTSHGMVVELQHSPIKSEERISRERFYKNMIWIVDGTRTKRDYPRFKKGIARKQVTHLPFHYKIYYPKECFPAAWLDSTVPIVFDFRGCETLVDVNDDRQYLYLLFPREHRKFNTLVIINRAYFIARVLDGSLFQKPEEPVESVQQMPSTLIISRPRGAETYIDGRGRIRRRSRF